jgi:hypothetical protein
MLSTESVVTVADDQAFYDLNGEVVILHFPSERYFGLEAVGARIWSLIQQPRRVTEIRDTIVREYDVDPERCEADILVLLEVLLSRNLARLADEKGT